MKSFIVIVNYNDYITTSKMVDNICNYSCFDKILIVDNCSTDNSYNELKKLENDKVIVIKSELNKGYAYGLNYGAKYLIDKYGSCKITFSNADIIIYDEESIKKLLGDFECDSKIGIVAPIIKERNGLNRGWKIPSPLVDCILNIPYIHKILRPKMLYYKDAYYKGLVSVDVVSGCFFIFDSNALLDVDFFDENTFLYYEENIISKKLQLKNYKVMIDSDVFVYHNHSVTIDKNVKRINKYKILKKSQMYFQKKYNKANIFEIMLLFLTNKITLFLMYILSIFKNKNNYK